jgi:hypothetical protein
MMECYHSRILNANRLQRDRFTEFPALFVYLFEDIVSNRRNRLLRFFILEVLLCVKTFF